MKKNNLKNSYKKNILQKFKKKKIKINNNKTKFIIKIDKKLQERNE